MVAKDSSPICFRVDNEERELVEAAAAWVGESLSAYMRHSAVETAQEIIKQAGGIEVVVEHYREVKRRRRDFQDRERDFLSPGPRPKNT